MVKRKQIEPELLQLQLYRFKLFIGVKSTVQQPRGNLEGVGLAPIFDLKPDRKFIITFPIPQCTLRDNLSDD